MAFEITRDYPVEAEEVDTPLGPTLGSRLARGITLVPILRAGLGMCDGVLELLPDAQVGHVGIFRDEQTLQPVEYYRKLPINLSDSDVILIDPMLATAGSLCKALEVVREAGAANIKVLCLLAAPEGIEALRRAHGEVPVFTAAIDDRLDERGFILPGLGDAGDRLYGTD
jgi:uracil phosphoribosyltransferase